MPQLETSIVRMYGVTENGNSVLAHIYNFRPYLYAGVPENMPLFENDLQTLKAEINVSINI
jgi:DNA polymerase elongation subunit (family B)